MLTYIIEQKPNSPCMLQTAMFYEFFEVLIAG